MPGSSGKYSPRGSAPGRPHKYPMVGATCGQGPRGGTARPHEGSPGGVAPAPSAHTACGPASAHGSTQVSQEPLTLVHNQNHSTCACFFLVPTWNIVHCHSTSEALKLSCMPCCLTIHKNPPFCPLARRISSAEALKQKMNFLLSLSPSLIFSIKVALAITTVHGAVTSGVSSIRRICPSSWSVKEDAPGSIRICSFSRWIPATMRKDPSVPVRVA